MGSNKKAKQAEADRARLQAQAESAAANIKPTAEASGVNAAAYKDFQTVRGGDISSLPFVAQYLQRAGAARQKAQQTTMTGDASLASRIANPNLVASSREMMDRSFEQQQASDVTDLASQTEESAVARIMGFSGQSMQGYSSQAGIYGGMANNAYERYLRAKQEGGFWSKLGKGLLGGVSAFASMGGSLAGIPGLGGLFPKPSGG